jgi:hypothetical protein
MLYLIIALVTLGDMVLLASLGRIGYLVWIDSTIEHAVMPLVLIAFVVTTQLSLALAWELFGVQ